MNSTQPVTNERAGLDVPSGSSAGRASPTDDTGSLPFLADLASPALLLAVFASYFALAQFTILLNDPVQLGAAFWPGAGLAMGLLLLLERPRWRWVLAGVAIAEVAGDLIHGYPVGAIAFWTAGNVVEPLLGAVLIRRFSSERGSLTPLRAFAGFVAFGVLVAPLVGGTIGSVGSVAFVGLPPTVVWPKYVIGDALGILVVAPILLTWRARAPARHPYEAALLTLSAAVVVIIVFGDWAPAWEVTPPYFVVPILMWSALRFGVRGVALTGFGVANIANLATATGYNPLVVAGADEHAVALLQLYLAVTLTTAFVVAALASDLTASRELARREAEHNAEVQRRRRFRDAFIGVLSHEIRTPITTMVGMSHVLRKGFRSMDAAVVSEHLGDLEAEADRLRRLMEDLLVLSRAEGGRLTVASDPIALPHLVRAVVDDERARWADHRLVLDAPQGIPVVVGDEPHVEQVLRNYISNAAKYSQPGTTIRVSLAGEADGVAVRVTDEGRGLGDDDPVRLFDLFYRAPGAAREAAGAGIGLFICRELIQAMGGRIWARDAPPPGARGAEFGFWLPMGRTGEDDDV